jgi:hypothetical protein
MPNARVLNVMLGMVLLFSAFASRSPVHRANTLVVAVLSILVAFAAMRRPRLRFLNVGLAVWLLVTTAVFGEASIVTSWSNTVVAIALFLVSLLPSRIPAGPASRAARSR